MEARWRRDGGETEASWRRAEGELEARRRRGEMADADEVEAKRQTRHSWLILRSGRILRAGH